MADRLPELDDIPDFDEALHVPGHALAQALADGRPWSSRSSRRATTD